MRISGQNILITGGAGFVGSHLADYLLDAGATVTIVDDCSSGSRDHLSADVEFVEADLTDSSALDGVFDNSDLVFHLAASKHVDTDQPHNQFANNTLMTRNVLEAMANAGVNKIAYTSSSTVYGEAPRPTPEDFAPLEPISAYGASKLADEALLSALAHTHDLIVWNFRFANVVGPRLSGAVIPDFIEKLLDNPTRLEILGDGRQEKSYLHINDCIDAMLYTINNTNNTINTYNLGTRTTTSVDRIAAIVADEMGVSPNYTYTGGDRGWTGDVPRMRLSIEKISGLGWEPKLSSDQAVRQATRELLGEIK